MNLGSAFIIGFIIYLAVMFLVSYKNRMSSDGDTGDYVLGGRQISLIVNIFGVCAIGFFRAQVFQEQLILRFVMACLAFLPGVFRIVS